MEHVLKANTLRPFIGAKDFALSRDFYRSVGFEEVVLGEKLSLFQASESVMFLLQDFYVEDWVTNSMLMLEVEDVESYFAELQVKDLASKYPGARLTEIKQESWGKVCYLHDPAGILWHICQFENG